MSSSEESSKPWEVWGFGMHSGSLAESAVKARSGLGVLDWSHLDDVSQARTGDAYLISNQL